MQCYYDTLKYYIQPFFAIIAFLEKLAQIKYGFPITDKRLA